MEDIYWKNITNNHIDSSLFGREGGQSKKRKKKTTRLHEYF
jgi:hypothetical protein